MTIRTYRSVYGHTFRCIREAALILAANDVEATDMGGLLAVRTGDIECRCDVFRSDLAIR